ncbi:lactosylceramide 4-alpha-galactosyltransferase-like isoform X2 [Photinus pyralis]|uniref:Alpha 1,4-glycosyltransferase domain-containing protein n=1 Tax=Photinus pyralis TaxID=7054 RepID=A0A1Y1ML67_PHOPY|nr:lactosylceramide 4-alpha-galactosyltransferase-like isoform X2 [Photinus pyralis]
MGGHNRDGKVEASLYARSHASDVLRYLSLWKYGGIYLDLDVIVIKPLQDLPANYAGSESENNVAAGVINFSPDGRGHGFAQRCLEDLRRNFRGKDWGYNGPGVITRLLKNLCGVKKAKDMLKKDCRGFKVYPPEAFYPVEWWNWKMYFDSKYNEKMLNITRNSYVIHVWNKHSVNTKIKINSEVPYSIFAKKYCPKVFAECEEYF